MKDKFYHKDILHCFPSLHPQTLISFSEKGLIKPFSEPNSRGGKRVYNYNNMLEIAFIHSLMAYNIPLKTIKMVVTGKAFQKFLNKNEFYTFFVMGAYYICSINAKTRKRTHESFWNMRWRIVSQSEFNKFDLSVSDIMIIVNLKRMKEILDDGLGK